MMVAPSTSLSTEVKDCARLKETINMGHLCDLLPINRTVKGVAVDPISGKQEFHNFTFVVEYEREFAPSLMALMESCRDHRVPPKTFVEIASLLIFGDESEEHILHTLTMLAIMIDVLSDDAS